MPREKDGFRDQLESIRAAYPQKECLTVCEVAQYTGIDRRRVPDKFTFIGKGKGSYITRTQLARQLS